MPGRFDVACSLWCRCIRANFSQPEPAAAGGVASLLRILDNANISVGQIVHQLPVKVLKLQTSQIIVRLKSTDCLVSTPG